MHSEPMPRYFFDTRDNEQFIPDEDGLELSGDEAARGEASSALATMARDVLPAAGRRSLSVVVRDEAKRPVLVAKLIFDVASLRGYEAPQRPTR